MSERISVGPFHLDHADFRALARKAEYSFEARSLSCLLLGLVAAGFILPGYVIARLTMTQFMSLETFEDLRALPIVGVAACGALITVWIQRRLARLTREEQLAGQRPQTLALSATGIDAMNGGIKSFIPWQEIDRVAVTSTHVFLFVNRLQAYILPKRSFETPEAASVCAQQAAAWHAAARA